MPLGRFFLFAGSLLLALLFLADRYIPQLAATPVRADVDRSIIRLQSRQKWLERIVIDTSLPTIVPPPAIAEAAPANSPPVARSTREAFAEVRPVQTATLAIAPKPAPKRRMRTPPTGGQVTSFDANESRNAFMAEW